MTSDVAKRIEALEAAQRQADLGPMIERIAERSGLSVEEIMAEATFIHNATIDCSEVERYAFVAADVGMSVAELRAAADRLLDVEAA